MTKPIIPVVMVVHNNLDITRIAIKSVLEQEHVTTVLIVIDNCSTDGTYKWLRARARNDDRLHWIGCMKQKSLSECWNIGIDHAFNNGYRQVMVVNNDIELRPDTAVSLSYEMVSRQISFLTAIAVNNREQLTIDSSSSLTFSPHPDFSCFMLNRECWERTGKFDESYYPAFYEDNDYHVRMHRAGIKAMSMSLPYLHHGSATIKNASPAEQEAIALAAQFNKEKFRAQYGCYPATPQYDLLFT